MKHQNTNNMKTNIFLSLAFLFGLMSSISFGQSCNASFYFINSSPSVNSTFNAISNSTYDSNAVVNYTWLKNGAFYTNTANADFNIDSTGTFNICLIINDVTNNCTDSFCKNIYVKPTGKCKVYYYFKDTIDSCHIVFDLGAKNVNDIDSFEFDYGDGTKEKFYAFQSKVVHEFSSSGRYPVGIVTWGMNGNCVGDYMTHVEVNGCNGNPLCLGEIKVHPYLDQTSLADSVNFPMGRYHLWNSTTYLIQKQGNNLVLLDSFSCDSCYRAYFDSLCADTYMVKTALKPTDQYYKDFLPTYSISELRWDSVQNPVLLNNNSSKWVDIYMIKGTNSGGPGFIGGNVNQGANKKDGEPLPGIEIILLDAAQNPVAYTYSNSQGEFEFDNLAYGEYYLFAEVLGLEIEGLNVSISEAKPKVENIEVEVGADKVVTSIFSKRLISDSEIKFYPNPSEGFVIIDNNKSGLIEIMDLSGKILLKESLSSNTKLNLEHLNSGSYILKFTESSGTISYARLVLN
jgi:hypothetical protein